MAGAWQFPGQLICQDCGHEMQWKFFHNRDVQNRPDMTRPNWHVICRTETCAQFGKRLTGALPTLVLTEVVEL